MKIEISAFAAGRRAFDDFLDQAVLERFRRADRIAANDHLDRKLRADRARQTLRATGARQQTELHFGQAEPRFLDRDAIVACQRNFETATERGTMDRSDDRLRRLLHEFENLGETGRLRRLAEFGDVGAGDEGAAAAGQHDGLHFGIGDRGLHAFENATAHRGAQRIDRGTVDRDDGDVVMTFEFYHFAHGTLPESLLSGSFVLGCHTTCVESLRSLFHQFRTAKFNSTS